MKPETQNVELEFVESDFLTALESMGEQGVGEAKTTYHFNSTRHLHYLSNWWHQEIQFHAIIILTASLWSERKLTVILFVLAQN